MPFYFGCTKKSNSLWTLDGITQNLREGPWLGYKEEKDRIISEKQHSFLFSKLSKDAYKRVKVGGFRSIMVKSDDPVMVNYVDPKESKWINVYSREASILNESNQMEIDAEKIEEAKTSYKYSTETDELIKFKRILMDKGIKQFDFKSERVESWLFRFEKELNLEGIDLDSAYPIIIHFLKGKMVNWYYLRSSTDNSWKTFRAEFISKAKDLLTDFYIDAIDCYDKDGILTCTKLMQQLSISSSECEVIGNKLDMINFVKIKLIAIRQVFPSLNDEDSRAFAVSLLDKEDAKKLLSYCKLDDEEFFSVLAAHVS